MVIMVMKKINNNFLKYMFYFAFLCCIVLVFYLYIRPIKNISVTSSYDTSAKRVYTEFDKNVVNYFVCDVDMFNSISLFFGKDSNIEDFRITLFDDNNHVIYEKVYDDMVGDMITFNFPVIENSGGKNYKLILDSDEAFHVYTTFPKEDGNYIEGNKDTTLVFTMSGYKDNYFYMWYPIMMIGMLIPFYIMIGGSKDVKKSR